MFSNKKFETEFAGRKLIVEVGKLAQQCNGACLVQYGDTVVLATAVMGKEPKTGIDFLPLTVEMQEKMYAAGKIKGSKFVKRDGRPTDTAVLDGRKIDRGIRPLFNQELRHEIQLATTTLSYDQENSADIVAINAGALALHISDIPWHGPLVGVCIGKINGELIVNPTENQIQQSEFKLQLSIAEEKILMIDAEGKEVSEQDLAMAFELGIKSVQPLLQFINKIRQEVGLKKQNESDLIETAWAGMEVSLADKKSTFEEAKKFFTPQLDKYLFNQPRGTKRERKEIAKKLLDLFIDELKTKETHQEIIDYIKMNFDLYLEEEVTKAILDKDLRIDGRGINDIRSLSAEIDILPRTHGTGLFQRGETQVLSIVTLGAPGDAQILDEMTQNDTKKSYIHFYSAPPYAYGEPGRFGSGGRREIGHGALAEKALVPVLPTKEDFPYTIVVVSEVMGSNGSSSMGSTCGSTLALMAAGVPIKKPVAGIAMGLASDGKRHKVITDLQDFEDGLGGMDFKVTGTKDGITAIQMDTKTNGLSLDLCVEAMNRAQEARLKILDVITSAITEPRKQLSPYAPKIICIKIDPEKIGEVIGTGGKVINKIIEECDVQIDIDDDGIVAITGVDQVGIDKATKWVEGIVKEVEVGEIYTGTVTRLMDFGAFMEILPGKEGLVHISEFSNNRIDKISDVATIGQSFTVKVIEIDDKGRINLSVKKASANYNPAEDRKNNITKRPFNKSPIKNNHNNNNHGETNNYKSRPVFNNQNRFK